MKLLGGQTVLLTGASGGLGTFMTYALAERGLKLALVAHPGADLEALRKAVEKRGCRAASYATDLRDPAQRRDGDSRFRRSRHLCALEGAIRMFRARGSGNFSAGGRSACRDSRDRTGPSGADRESDSGAPSVGFDHVVPFAWRMGY